MCPLLSGDTVVQSVRVRISALALLKMAMHAKSGGNIEVMGMLQVRIATHHAPNAAPSS